MRWPLRYQILVPFAAAMLAVVVGVSLLDAFLAARRTQRQIERQLREVAQTLLDANFPLTDAVLRQTRGLSGAEFLLTDAQGGLLASSMAERNLLPLPAAEESQFALGNPVQLSGQSYFHTVGRVRPNGSHPQAAQLHILYPEQFLRDARWQAAYPPLVLGSVLLVVVILLAVMIAGRLSRPILELRMQLGRLVGGSFQPLPLPSRNDELRDLIGSVNALGEELEDLRQVIARSERLAILGQLSGGLAHQLRNSVTGAKIAVQIHRRHCGQIDQDSLDVALRQLAMTEAHLQRFLTAGQPSAPRQTKCDLCGVVADVAALVAPAFEHRGVRLDWLSAGPPCEASIDAGQIRQLLLNLVLNGLEAAGAGGWVRIELARRDQRLVLRVIDSGPGPDQALRDRLFEPFSTGKPEGIGLGLAVARTIAEAHGGTLDYLPARPTTFELLLPDSLPSARAADEAPEDALTTTSEISAHT